MIDVISFLRWLLEFCLKHDQAVVMTLLGWWWFKRIKKIECSINIQTDTYKRALRLFTEWWVDRQFMSFPTGDKLKLDKLNLKNESMAHKIFDQLAILGSPAVRRWIKNARKSSLGIDPRPWITNENIKEFIYLI